MIALNDFRAEPEALIYQELAAAERVIRSGWYVLGQEVETFEHAWATVCGTSYAVGVGNGLDALEIGLKALGIGPGDEVVTTPMTAFATVLAIHKTGAIPVLADIVPETALLDVASVERCLTERTRAVLLVHLYGQIHGMDHWTTFCRQNRLHLLEDCAQAHLATWQGKRAGSFGEWGAYSFYPTKNLGAIGDAGILVTSQAAIAQQARVLRNYGQSDRYHHTELGMNSRLDELQAALLQVRLAWLEPFTTRRRQIAGQYFAQIHNSKISLLSPPVAEENHVYHLFVVRCAEREQLARHLKIKGITTLSHYPLPAHHQQPSQDLARDPMGLLQAEQHAADCLSIPCHPQMSDRDVQSVIEALNEF